MATPNFEVDLNDKRLTDITDAETAGVNESNANYDKMIADNDKLYAGFEDKIDEYKDKQTEIQNKQTEFAIEKIEQQKDQAHKSYTKEQAGAWSDYQKQTDPYGVEAEKMANMGMTGTGYAESANTRAYIAYQNRITTAKASYDLAVMNYNNNIKEAQLQNDAVLAEIYYNAFQQQLELSLQGAQIKNQLLMNKADAELKLKSFYADKWKNMLDQINTENALAEEARQFDEQQRINEAQLKIAEEELKIKKAQSAAGGGTRKVAKSAAKTAAKNAQQKVTKPSNPVSAEKAKQQYYDAADAIEQMIAKGATKDQISNAISLALREGELTQQEAANLRRSFTPRGVQY